LKTLNYDRTVAGRLRLHVLPTRQFKTYAISVYIGQPLAEQTVTPYALIPFVLRRGTQTYPETKQFRERLDEMYGAGFGFDIYKRGDYQIVQFRMDIIQDQFVSGTKSLLDQAFQFLGDVLTRPALEDGVFRAKYVEDEKTTITRRIEAMINDKIRYAAERCIAEMCRNEPYRLHPLGKIEDLEGLTPELLYNHYQHWLSTAPIDIYVVGDTTLDEVKALVEQYFRISRADCFEYRASRSQVVPAEVNTVVERLEVSQGKLNMGLRTPVTYSDPEYPAMLMYNGILGAYPHSKLFINVREKASLAYYASSRLDGHKGILTIQSGIEIENYEKALGIIREQLDAMERGEISDLELSQTRAMIANQLTESQDSAFELIAFDFNAVLSGKQRSVNELIEQIGGIGKREIQETARKVKLDTVYFLRDRKGEK